MEFVNPSTILVTGATGKQGSAVVDALLAYNEQEKTQRFEVIGVTRKTTSPSAQKLAKKFGVFIVEGDLSDPDLIFEQVAKLGKRVWGVFSVQVNSPDEEKQGKALVTSSVAHGVKYFVYASGDRGGPQKSETDPTFVKNFASKFRIEKHLQTLAANSPQKMTYTILRPVTFFENMTADIHGKGFARMWEQIGQDKPLQLISTVDIGYFAALAFRNSNTWENVAITLVGDELTQEQADRIFLDATGSKMELAPCPVGSAVKFFKKDTVGDMLKWFEENGYGGDLKQCRGLHPGLLDYRAWLKTRSPFVERH